MTVVVTFYTPMPGPDGIDDGSFSISLAERNSAVDGCTSSAKGDLSLSADLPGDSSYGYSYSSASLTGYNGTIPVTVTVSSDRTAATFTLNHAALANRPWNCAGSIHVSSDFSSDDSAKPFWIGHVPACADGADNDEDGAVDRKDWACSSDGDETEEALQADLPSMSAQAGKTYMTKALRRGFGSVFTRGIAQTLDQCKATDRLRQQCRVRWVKGERSFSGLVSAWYYLDGEDAMWGYAYSIRRTDDRCVARHRKHCTKLFKVT